MFIGEGRVPFDTVVPFIPRVPSPSDVFPAKIQNGGTTFVVERKAGLLFGRIVSLIQMMISFLSWRRLQPIRGAIFTDIKVFNENILPAYTVDQFESQFSMTRGTFELLCREVQATGRVPQQHAFGRPPIPLDKQVLAFVWFIANFEVIRSV